MTVLIVKMPERQKQGLKSLSAATGLGMSELIRRMVDHCCRDNVLDVLVPPLSGSLSVSQGGRTS